MSIPRLPLSNIAAKIDYGLTASANEAQVGPKFLRITDIQDDAVDWDDVPFCEATPKKLAKARIEPGDIVFARTGATTGKSFLINDPPEDAVFASYLIRVRSSGRAIPSYLAHFFRSQDYWSQIKNRTRGAAQGGVNATSLGELDIPLPPLEEQRRIAGILDAADALRRRRREALALLDTLPGAIFAEMFDGSTDIEHREIGELGRVVTGATPPSKKENMFGGPIPFVTPGDLEGDGSTVRTVTEEGAMASRTVRGGSTLVCCIGATIGKISQFNESVAFNQQINAVEWGDEIEPAFGTQVMRLIKANIIGSAKSTTLPILKKSLFEKLPIPVVSKERQRKFAGLVESVEARKGSMKAHLFEIETLFASLQSRAFAGEL
jgi:type I restriction enzyme S subunit